MQDSSGSRALARCAQGAARHDPPRQQGPSDIAGHPVALHFTGRRRAPFWRRPYQPGRSGLDYWLREGSRSFESAVLAAGKGPLHPESAHLQKPCSAPALGNP
jgi:hypothetical protein